MKSFFCINHQNLVRKKHPSNFGSDLYYKLSNENKLKQIFHFIQTFMGENACCLFPHKSQKKFLRREVGVQWVGGCACHLKVLKMQIFSALENDEVSLREQNVLNKVSEMHQFVVSTLAIVSLGSWQERDDKKTLFMNVS
jgi:hypothetical protein